MQVINEIATLYFRDKKSKIDYVLAYEDEQDEKKKERRQTFQDNLTDEGLILEFEEKEVIFTFAHTHKHTHML